MNTLKPKSLIDCYHMIDAVLDADGKNIVMKTRESDIETAFHFSSLGLWIRNEIIRKHELKASELYDASDDLVLLSDPDNMCCSIIKGYREHLINKHTLTNR